jgi:hypothetical protein
LLIYGRLPTADELKDYIRILSSLRELPGALKDILERIPGTAHPMVSHYLKIHLYIIKCNPFYSLSLQDVVRTGCSALGVCIVKFNVFLFIFNFFPLLSI